MQKQKTILFDGRFLSLSHAGIGRYSCELLKEVLPQLRESEKMIILIKPGAKFDDDLSEAIKNRPDTEVIETNINHYSLKEQTDLLKLLNSIKPDLVHFPHFNHPILYKGKFVVTIHDLTLSHFAERSNFMKTLIYNKVISSAARNSKKIFTVSGFVKNEMVKKLQLPSSKVVVTHNGIDEKFKKITNPRVLQKAEKYNLIKPYYLYVGQWRSHKNLLILVEAFSSLVKKGLKGKVELVLAGKIDPKYPQLQALVKKLSLEKDVRFTGFISDEDLPIIYNNALAFVFPSLSEGFGLPALEAQACGTPVISSDNTSMPEILSDGALYFDGKNQKQLEGKMIDVLKKEKLRDELIAKGLENTKKFSWKQTASKSLEVYRELLYK